MPYRVRSTDVWFNLGGVVAAWQPVAAPDPFAARQNVGNDARRAGVYAATLGTAPAWSGATGWGFTAASSQYLTTGIVVSSSTWSAIVSYSGAASGTWPFGADGAASTTGNQRWGILAYNAGTDTRFCNCGQKLSLAHSETAGVLGFADRSYYREGALWGADIPAGTVPTVPVTIGALNRSAAPVAFFTGNIQAFAIYSRPLTNAEMWQASRQMAYCHVNPDWSAWGRMRRYYYAEYAAAGNVGIYGKRGAVALPGGVRIEAVQ